MVRPWTCGGSRLCFLSLLDGAFRSRFLFFAGAPVPAFMCLLLSCPREGVCWCVAYRLGTLAMSPGVSSALALSRDPAGWACVGFPVTSWVLSSLA